MRTVPDITTAATLTQLSLRYVDDANQLKAVSADIDSATTDAQIEALVVAAAAITNANIWRVVKSSIWTSVRTPSTVDAEQNSVYDMGLILFQQAGNAKNQEIYLPALIEGAMDGDTTQINTAAATYIAVRDAWEDVMVDAYEPVSARYVQHAVTNKAVAAS